MKLLKPFILFGLLLVYDANAQAPRFKRPAPVIRTELLLTPDQRFSKGAGIDSLEYLRYNADHDLVAKKRSGQKIVLPYKDLWGIRYYYNDISDEIYRTYSDPRFSDTSFISALKIIKESDLILYATNGSRKHHPVYFFSRTITSKIERLDLDDLEEEFKDTNPCFLKLVRREMNVWTGYNTINQKTGEFIILELYRASLESPCTSQIQDTSLYHLKKLKRDGTYWLFNLQLDQYTLNNSPGRLTSAFPYYSVDTVTRIAKTESVRSDTKPFQKKPLFIDFGFEYDRFRNCYGVQLGFTGDYSRSLHFGLYYGFAWDLNLSSSHKKKITIKPGINLSYNTYSTLMADIDNTNKYVTTFSSTFNPAFLEAEHHSHSATTYTRYQAKDIKVYYAIRCWSICPMLTLASNRDRRIHCALNTGWNLTFYDNSGFTLQQRNDNHDGKEESAPFNGGNSVSNKTGNGLFKAPFKFGGPFVGVSFGIYLNPR